MQQSFVQETILAMNPVAFDRLKAALLGEYIQFRIVTPESITKEIFAEKLHDYFEKLQYKTGKKFEDLLKNYMAELDSLVEPHVAKTSQAKKNEPAPITPRSRKYYEKAVEIKKAVKSPSELTDYSRLMLCLYAAVINSGEERISNLDFSLTCMKPDVIIAALKNEKESALFGKKNPKPRYLREPEMVNTQWLFWRTKQRYFQVGQIAVCLLKLSWDTWLLTTIKRVTKELNVYDGINY